MTKPASPSLTRKKSVKRGSVTVAGTVVLGLEHNHDLDWSAKDGHLSREPSEMDVLTLVYGGSMDEDEGPTKPKAKAVAATTTAAATKQTTTTPAKSSPVQPTPVAPPSVASVNTTAKPTDKNTTTTSVPSQPADRTKFAVKDKIEANYQEDGTYFPGHISRVNDDGTYDIGTL